MRSESDGRIAQTGTLRGRMNTINPEPFLKQPVLLPGSMIKTIQNFFISKDRENIIPTHGKRFTVANISCQFV